MADTSAYVPRAEVGGTRFCALPGEALTPFELVPRRLETEASLWTLPLLPRRSIPARSRTPT